MPGVLFSVIIPSYNRVDEIVELLQSLGAQTYEHQHFEVLVVDDGSTDQTGDRLTQLQDTLSFQIRFFQREHAGPGAARNFGMSQAVGEYFLFIDSDCIADRNWLQAISFAIANEKPDAFGGPDSVLPDFSPMQKAIDYAMTSFMTTGGMRGHSRSKLARFYPRSFNMGIHRRIYEKLGGMNNLRHGQDLELSRRIVASGAKVIYVPDAVVYHKRRTSLRKFFRQIFNWGVARINLTKLDRAILEPLHFMPAAGVVGFLLLLCLAPFSNLIFKVWLAGLTLVGGLMILIVVGALRRYHDVKAGLLAPVVAVTQIFGYGLGFTAAFIWRMVLGRPEFTGFVKKYYQ